MTAGRLADTPRETLRDSASTVSFAAASREALLSRAVAARFTGDAREALHDAHARARFALLVQEVLYSAVPPIEQPPIFPSVPGLTFPMIKVPSFATHAGSGAGGVLPRQIGRPSVIWDYTLKFSALDSDQNYPGVGGQTLQQIQGFLLDRWGAAGPALFLDPTDCTLANALIGIGDGGTQQFIITRTMGSTYAEPVGWVFLADVTSVTIGGTPLAGTDWNIVNPNVLNLKAAPVAGKQIRISVRKFYFQMTLADSIPFEEMYSNLWDAKELKFKTLVPNYPAVAPSFVQASPPPKLPSVPGLGFPVKKTPSFSTMAAIAASGKRDRQTARLSVLWEFVLPFEILCSDDATGHEAAGAETLQAVMGFYLDLFGAAGSFLLLDPSDCTLTDQNIGTGDGTTTHFTVTRPVASLYAEPVGWIFAADITLVTVNGVPVPSLYWSIAAPNTLVLATAPGPSQAVQISTNKFYFEVVFPDSLSFEEFMWQMWEQREMRLTSVPPAYPLLSIA